MLGGTNHGPDAGIDPMLPTTEGHVVVPRTTFVNFSGVRNASWLPATLGNTSTEWTLMVEGKHSWGANPLAASSPRDGVADGGQSTELDPVVVQPGTEGEEHFPDVGGASAPRLLRDGVIREEPVDRFGTGTSPASEFGGGEARYIAEKGRAAHAPVGGGLGAEGQLAIPATDPPESGEA